MTYGDSALTVWSGSPINVDPTDPSTVYFVVVSQNDAGSDFDYTLTFTDGAMSTDPEIPDKFSISHTYPNPFNPQTNIQIDLQNPQRVQVYIYDIKGQMVKTLVNRQLVAGQHVFTWNGRNYQGLPVSTGTYFVRIKGKSQERWQKVTLLK